MPGYKEFGERLRISIRNNRITQKELCSIWQINESSLVRYLSGERLPKIDLLEQMSKSLSVSIDWLITGEEFTPDLNPNEQHLISNYRKCTDQNKSLIQNTAAALAGSEPVQPAGSSNLKIG